MRLSKIINVLSELTKNIRRLLGIAFDTDKRLTKLYYITTVIGSSAPIFASIAMRYVIDYLQIVQNSLNPSLPIVVLVALGFYYAITIIEDVVFYGLNYSYLDYIFRYKLQNKISLDFYKKVSHLDLEHFENPQTQDLISKTRDTMLWRVPDFLRTTRDITGAIVAYISAFIVLFPFGFWVPLTITVVTLPRIYLRAKYGAIQWSLYGSGAPQAKKLWYMGHLLNDIRSIKEMRIFQSTSSLLERYEEIQIFLYKLNKRGLDKYIRARNIPIFIETFTIFVIAYQFLPETVAGAMTIGNFTLLITLMSRLNSNAASSAQQLGELYEDNLYVNHFFDTKELPELIKEAKAPKKLASRLPPKIEFKNVTFSYPNGPKVLDNISFTINPGESVAFVGQNGAGKSTIVKLLCRFYDIDSGEILIDGINIKELKKSNWYSYLGTLFQEFTQYHFSIKDNITLANKTKLDRGKLLVSAKKSGADEFIEKLPEKYDTLLGREFEDGVELSGGQWQKLAIARAFYQQPPILILDEPTSAIDAEAEYEIFRNLQNQYKDKTLILVSHRFSTVRNANKIIVIENGNVIEEGSHNKLFKQKGKYFKMFTTQAKGYK